MNSLHIDTQSYTQHIEYGVPFDSDGSRSGYGSATANQPTFETVDYIAISIAVIATIFLGFSIWMGLGQTGLFITGGLYCIAILISPFVGFCLVGFSLSLSGLIRYADIFTVSKALSIAVVISFLPRLWTRRRNYFHSKLLLVYLLVSLWMLLVVPFAKFPGHGLVRMVSQFLLLGMAFLVVAVPKNINQLRAFCMSICLGALFLGGYSAVTGLEAQGLTKTERLAAGLNENELGHVLALALFASVVAWFRIRATWQKVLIILINFMIVAAVGMTNSRGAWLAIAMGTTGAPILARKATKKHRSIFFILAISFGLVGFSLVLYDAFASTGDLVLRRITEIETGDASGGRYQYIWPEKIDAFLNSPLWGHGPGYDRGVFLSSHNDILYVLVSSGLVGGVLYAMMFIIGFRESISLRNSWLSIAGVGTLVFLIGGGLFHTSIGFRAFAVGIGIVCALKVLECEENVLLSGRHPHTSPVIRT